MDTVQFATLEPGPIEMQQRLAHLARRVRMGQSQLRKIAVMESSSSNPASEEIAPAEHKELPFIRYEGPISVPSVQSACATAWMVNDGELLLEQMTMRARSAFYLCCFLATSYSGVGTHEIGYMLGKRKDAEVLEGIERATMLIRVDEKFAIQTAIVEHELGLVRWGEQPLRVKLSQESTTASGRPKEWWEDFQQQERGSVKLETFIQQVCIVDEIPRNDLLAAGRCREWVRSRQFWCLLTKRHTKRSLPELGRRLGGRDHTTVLHNVRKGEQRIVEEEDFAIEVVYLEHRLGFVRWGDQSPGEGYLPARKQ